MGGWTQVAAHGTGATLPTVDEITRMKIITPGQGVLELSRFDTGDRAELSVRWTRRARSCDRVDIVVRSYTQASRA